MVDKRAVLSFTATSCQVNVLLLQARVQFVVKWRPNDYCYGAVDGSLVPGNSVLSFYTLCFSGCYNIIILSGQWMAVWCPCPTFMTDKNIFHYFLQVNERLLHAPEH
jgi:hypothetical protein